VWSWKTISRTLIPAWAPSWRHTSENQTGLSGGQEESIGADVPIRNADQDRLRRVAFASRIAAILSDLNLDEGRVFAIRGGWGHGKSSLKNLIVEKLAALDEGADWVEFNPWQWGDADAIAKALFQQIADKLGGGYSSIRARLARKPFSQTGAPWILRGRRWSRYSFPKPPTLPAINLAT